MSVTYVTDAMEGAAVSSLASSLEDTAVGSKKPELHPLN